MLAGELGSHYVAFHCDTSRLLMTPWPWPDCGDVMALQGACGSCPSSLTTMTMGIKRRLMEKIPVRGDGLPACHVRMCSDTDQGLGSYIPCCMAQARQHLPATVAVNITSQRVDCSRIAVPQEILEVEQVMDEQAGMELTGENVEQVTLMWRPTHSPVVVI